MVGKIISLEGNRIVIQPKHDELKEPLEFGAHELKKYFNMGDHVKVINGQYEGDTGLIVRVEDNLIVLFSDLSMHEMKVRINTVKKDPCAFLIFHLVSNLKRVRLSKPKV